jgi:hypothetical protein
MLPRPTVPVMRHHEQAPSPSPRTPTVRMCEACCYWSDLDARIDVHRNRSVLQARCLVADGKHAGQYTRADDGCRSFVSGSSVDLIEAA